VSNNIADGFERGSTTALLMFLYIARGSAGEVRSMPHFSERLPEAVIFKYQIKNLKSLADSCSRQLRARLVLVLKRQTDRIGRVRAGGLWDRYVKASTAFGDAIVRAGKCPARPIKTIIFSFLYFDMNLAPKRERNKCLKHRSTLHGSHTPFT
jgi:hypothetical protein